MALKRSIKLTDVLIIVGVVGLICSLAIPVFGNGVSRAQKSLCLSNMKEIAVSLQMYAEANDGMLPRTTEDRPKRGLGAHWTYLIQPYVRSDKIFVCPADPAPAYTYVDQGSRRLNVPRLSYINNYAAIPAHDFFPVPTSLLASPNQFIVIGERRSHHPVIGAIHGWKGMSAFLPGQPCHDEAFDSDYFRVTAEQAEAALPVVVNEKQLLLVRLNWTAHGSESNYSFADGHAAYQPLGLTLDPNRFEWGDRFYPVSQEDARCDGTREDAARRYR